MIELKNVYKELDQNIILDYINLKIKDKTIVGIVGRNGSGKSMMFRAICGLIIPDSGEIIINGNNITKKNAFSQDIRALIEKPNFIENSSALDNLLLLASIQKKIGKEEILKYLKQFGLYEVRNKAVGKYSLGMKQKLGIIQVLMEDPQIMIFDEPFSGLDKQSVKDVKKILLDEKKKGKTILIASHIDSDLKGLCDEFYEMDVGRLEKIKRTSK